MQTAQVEQPSEIAQLLERTMRLVYGGRRPSRAHRGQWMVLRFLANARPEQRTVSGVAKHLAVTSAPASRAVAALVRKGHVEVAKGKGKGKLRGRIISLTEGGRASLREDPIHDLTAEIERLASQQRNALAQSLGTIVTALGQS